MVSGCLALGWLSAACRLAVGWLSAGSRLSADCRPTVGRRVRSPCNLAGQGGCMPQSKGAACRRARGLHAPSQRMCMPRVNGCACHRARGLHAPSQRMCMPRVSGCACLRGVRLEYAVRTAGGGTIRVRRTYRGRGDDPSTPYVPREGERSEYRGEGAQRPGRPAGLLLLCVGGGCSPWGRGGLIPRAPMVCSRLPCSSECRAAGWTGGYSFLVFFFTTIA